MNRLATLMTLATGFALAACDSPAGLDDSVTPPLMATMALSGSVLGEANLIVNGDFEIPLVGDGYRSGANDWDYFTPDDADKVGGWTVEINGNDGGPVGPDLEFWNFNMGLPYSGSQYVELDGFDPTKISQDVVTILGALYDLTYAWRPRVGPTDRMKVWVNGAEVGDHSGAAGTWRAETYSFKASSSSSTIAFEEVGADDQLGMLLDAVALVLRRIDVDIDIKPGSYPNSFNINGKGVIPVAVIGSETLDVTDIDTSTLDFGGLAVRVKGNGAPQCSIEDPNGDGFDDLVCQFVDDATTWTPGDAVATLTGLLSDGTFFEGTDEINIVP